MEIGERVRAFLGMHVKQERIADEDNIFEKGYVSSLFAMQLVAFLEREFELSIENSELNLENFKSVNAISSFVERKLAWLDGGVLETAAAR